MATSATRQHYQSILDAPQSIDAERGYALADGGRSIAQEWMRLADLYGEAQASQILSDKGGGNTLGNTAFDGAILAGGAAIGGAGAASMSGGGGAAAGAGAGESVSGAYAATPYELSSAAGSYGGTATTVNTAAKVGGSTALSRILDGSGSTADYASVLGNAGMAAYGAYASDKQTDAYKELAEKYMAMGAPYRDQLATISADPNAFYNSTGAQASLDATLRKLSVNGNPAGSPYSQSLAVGSLYGEYGKERDRLAGYGGLTAYNQAAPTAATNAIGSESNYYNALGAGAADLFGQRKQRTLSEILSAGGY